MKFEKLKDFMEWKPPDFNPLVGDASSAILVPSGRAVIFGRWGTWKSMLLMDLLISSSQGSKWMIHNTKRCKVALLQIEIPAAQMQLRLKTYLDGHLMVEQPQGFYVGNEPFFKLNNAGIKELRTHLSGIRPDILAIDPVYKVIPGDPNKSDEVGALLDVADEIVYNYQCAIIFVGHIRKRSQALDEEVAMSGKVGSRIHLKYEKVRHSHVEIPDHDIVVTREQLMFRTAPCLCGPTRNLEDELTGNAYFSNWADTMISLQEATMRREQGRPR